MSHNLNIYALYARVAINPIYDVMLRCKWQYMQVNVQDETVIRRTTRTGADMTPCEKNAIPCDWREESCPYTRMRYHQYALSSRYDEIHIWCFYVDMTYSHRSTVHASLECSNDSEKEERRTIEKVCFNELKDYGILNFITRTPKLCWLMMTTSTSSPLNFISWDLWLFAWTGLCRLTVDDILIPCGAPSPPIQKPSACRLTGKTARKAK